MGVHPLERPKPPPGGGRTPPGYSLERLRRFWTSPGRRGASAEKLHVVPTNSEEMGALHGFGCFLFRTV